MRKNFSRSVAGLLFMLILWNYGLAQIQKSTLVNDLKSAFKGVVAYNLATESVSANFPTDDEEGKIAWGQADRITAFIDNYVATRDASYLENARTILNYLLSRRDDKRNVRDYRGRQAPLWRNVNGQIPTVNNAPVTTYAKLSNEDDDGTALSTNPAAKRFYAYYSQPLSALILYPYVYFAEVVYASKLDQFMSDADTYLQAVEDGFGWFEKNYDPASYFVLSDPRVCKEGNDKGGFYTEERFAIENRKLTGQWAAGPDGNPEFRQQNMPYNRQNLIGTVYAKLCALYKADGTGPDNADKYRRYRQRTEELAQFFKLALKQWPGTSYASHAYYWYYRDNVCPREFAFTYEDAGHGAVSMQFAFECFKEQIVFNEQDMRRFANTYLKLMKKNKWASEDKIRYFFNPCVDGSINPGYNCDCEARYLVENQVGVRAAIPYSAINADVYETVYRIASKSSKFGGADVQFHNLGLFLTYFKYRNANADLAFNYGGYGWISVQSLNQNQSMTGLAGFDVTDKKVMPIQHAVVGDFDGDGVDDLAFNYGKGDFITIQTVTEGKRKVIKSFSIGDVNRPIRQMVAGDFNGDGIDDLAVNYEGSDRIAILTIEKDNQGNPNQKLLKSFNLIQEKKDVASQANKWIKELSRPGSGKTTVKHMLVGDFNGDTVDDLAFSYTTNNINDLVDVRTIVNGEAETLVAFRMDEVKNLSPNFMAAGDFDGDGIDEFAFNYGEGTFISVQKLLFGKEFQGKKILKTFNASDKITAPLRFMAVGDFNADGKSIDDLVFAYSLNNTVTVRTFDEQGNIKLAGEFTVGETDNAMINKLAVGDFNRDGAADVALNTGNGNRVSIYTVAKGQPALLTSFQVTTASSGPLQHMVSGDFSRMKGKMFVQEVVKLKD